MPSTTREPGALRLSLRGRVSGVGTFSRAFSIVLMVRETVGCETSRRWSRASWVRLCRWLISVIFSPRARVSLRGFSAGLTQVWWWVRAVMSVGVLLGGEAGSSGVATVLLVWLEVICRDLTLIFLPPGGAVV